MPCAPKTRDIFSQSYSRNTTHRNVINTKTTTRTQKTTSQASRHFSAEVALQRRSVTCNSGSSAATSRQVAASVARQLRPASHVQVGARIVSESEAINGHGHGHNLPEEGTPREVKKKRPFSDPFYWAGFIVIGHGSASWYWYQAITAVQRNELLKQKTRDHDRDRDREKT